MEEFSTVIEVRWSDLDPNFHVLHSKYYDYGAYCRMDFLVKNGFTPDIMKEFHIGPILFREECFFKKELRFGDEIRVGVKLQRITSDYAKWSMQHDIWKNGDTLAATINVDAAWMDTQKRKLTVPPKVIADIFESSPKSENFQVIIR